MAELLQTSRAPVDRLLDPHDGGATIESLQRAARIVGRELRLELVWVWLVTCPLHSQLAPAKQESQSGLHS